MQIIIALKYYHCSRKVSSSHSTVVHSKVWGDIHLAEGYWAIYFLDIMGKFIEGVVEDRLSYILETRHLLSN